MEFHTPVVICDKCHPGEDILIDNGALLNEPAHGYSVGFSVEQMLENGWEEREYGVICPVCVVDEKTVAESDEIGQVEHGPITIPTPENDNDAE